MDMHWNLFINNRTRISRFEQLKCRIAIASSMQPISIILLLFSISLAMSLNR